MLPLMVMVCYDLWQWYVTTYGNGMLRLMAMVCYRLWQWYVTAYGNVLQLTAVMSYNYSSSVLQLTAIICDTVCRGFWAI
jgi:hypothetical protein